MKKLLTTMLPLALLAFSSGCNSKDEAPKPKPAPGTRGANEYDIKVSYTHHHLNHQPGPDGQVGFSLGAVVQLAAGEAWSQYIGLDPHMRGETVTLYPRTDRKGYTFPVSLAFTAIKATNDPVQLASDIYTTATVLIDGKAVEVLHLDHTAGYIDMAVNGTTQRVKGVTATVDLSRY